MIYVMGVRRDGVVKIGTAENPKARLRAIQAGYPEPLHVLLSAPGDRALERQLHALFRARRVSVRREWFDFSGADAVRAVEDALERRPWATHDPRSAVQRGDLQRCQPADVEWGEWAVGDGTWVGDGRVRGWRALCLVHGAWYLSENNRDEPPSAWGPCTIARRPKLGPGWGEAVAFAESQLPLDCGCPRPGSSACPRCAVIPAHV